MPRACRTMPAARVRRSTAETAACSSVSSWIACGVRGHARHEADEPVSGDDGVVDADAAIRARCDDDCLRERPCRPADHLGGDGVEVAREARAVDVVEQTSQGLVLLERELALDRTLTEIANLDTEALRIRACGQEAVGPAVRVSKRLRDPLEPDRERAQGRRSGGLDAVERAASSRAERDRDEDERTRAPESPRRVDAEVGLRRGTRELVGEMRRTGTPSAADRALRCRGTTGQSSLRPGFLPLLRAR